MVKAVDEAVSVEVKRAEVRLTEDEALQQNVEQIKVLYDGYSRASLQMHWLIGKMVADLDTKYGSGSVKKLSNQLREEDVPGGFGETQLYKMRQFFDKIPEKDMVKMADKRISWRQLANSLAAEPRQLLRVASQVPDEIKPEKFEEAIKQMLDTKSSGGVIGEIETGDGSDPVKPGGLKSLRGMLTRVESSASKLLPIIGSVKDFADRFDAADKEDQAAVMADVTSLRTQLQTLQQTTAESLQFLEQVKFS